MNKVILMGRLTATPDMRQSNELMIARFSLAVDRKYSKDKATDFFNCVAFGKQASFCEKYLNKGTKVVVSGRIQIDEYTNKDGNKIKGVQIVLEEIEFAESKKASEQEQGTEWVNIPDNIDDELPFN